jgi:hypothetical protein
MNIYEKLSKARIKLQESNIKKSGNNKFAGYDYFELGDFLPTINNIFDELKLCSLVTFEKELAYLTIVDSEKPEDKIMFTSPMATASLKGCHDVQNLGAVETYERRYLYMMALEISEHDNLDSLTGKEEPLKQHPKPKQEQKWNMTKEHLDTLASLSKQKNVDLKVKGKEWTGKDGAKDWTSGDYSKVLNELNKLEDAKHE